MSDPILGNKYLSHTYLAVPWRRNFIVPHQYAILEDIVSGNFVMSPVLIIGASRRVYLDKERPYRYVSDIMAMDRESSVFKGLEDIPESMKGFRESTNSSILEYLVCCMSMQNMLGIRHFIISEDIGGPIVAEANAHFNELFYMLGASFIRAECPIHDIYFKMTKWVSHVFANYGLDSTPLEPVIKIALDSVFDNMESLPVFPEQYENNKEQLLGPEETDQLDTDLWSTAFGEEDDNS